MAAVQTRYGTRWGRASIPIVVGFGAIAACGSLVLNNALAVNFTLQNANAKFSSSAIYAQNAGLGMATATTQGGTTKAVLRAGFASASLDGLCVSKVDTISIGGVNVSVTLRLQAGNSTLSTGNPPSDGEIKANNATFDITSLRGMNQSGQAGTGVNLNGLDEIGIATPDVQTTSGVTNPLDGPTTRNGEGWLGISGTSATFYSVKGTLWDAAISGNIVLPNLKITAGTSGVSECWTSQSTTTDLPK